MTAPKLVVAGQSVSFTIRTLLGQMYLVPDKDAEKQKMMGYLIGHALLKSDLVLHGFCAMSNHLHYTGTDIGANRDCFTRRFHGNLATKCNQLYERSGTFWGNMSEKTIMSQKAMVDKLLYDWLNPVKANLVARVDDWEGFMILPKHWGKPMTFERPSTFPEDTWPPSVTFTPMPPAFFHHMPLDEAIAFFEKKIVEKEAEYHNKRKTKVLGMRACFLVDPASRPGEQVLSMREQRQARNRRRKLRLLSRRKRSPNQLPFACDSADEDSNITRYREFRKAYKEAREAYKQDKSTAFPFGTFLKVHRENAPCASTTPSDRILPSAYNNDYLAWYLARFGPDGHDAFFS